MRKAAALLLSVILLAASAWAQDDDPQRDQDGAYLPGRGVSPARLLTAVPAVIPSDSRSAEAHTVCALLVLVTAEGKADNIQIVSRAQPALDDAAIAAVRGSTFQPGFYNEKPVPTHLLVWVPFVGGEVPAVPVSGMARRLEALTVPSPLSYQNPEYSSEARRKRINGTVTLQFLLTEDGLPTRETVISGLGYGLDEKALETLGKYRFRPARLYGVPVPYLMTMVFSFHVY